MAAVKDSIVDLERYRLQLEDSVAKLRKSLQYWQTWEADYEGMKEEILGLEEVHTEAELVQVGRDYGGTVLNDKEVNLLFNDQSGKPRSGRQIVNLISRRLDYVQENVKSVSKQLELAEQKLVAPEVDSRPDTRVGEGLPLTEIREELDDGGNVISSSATKPGDTAPQIVEALRKAGAKDLPETSASQSSKMNLASNRIEEIDDGGPAQKTSVVPEDAQSRQDSEDEAKKPPEPAGESPLDNDDVRPLGRKKSVTFAAGTKTEDSTISRKRLPHPLFAKPRPTPTSSKIETIADVEAKTPEGQLNSLLHAEANILSSNAVSNIDAEIVSPVIPEKESPEDAALRRQMLQYNMQQVGSVVAEIDLDEQGEGSTPPYSSDEDQDDYDSSVEEEEDEHGRAKNVVLSESYIKEMQALERRLNASLIRNVGPNAKIQPSPSDHERGESELATSDSNESSITSPTGVTKAVRFAEKLDIQEAPTLTDSTNLPSHTSGHTESKGRPISAPTAPPEKKRVSRFKSARATGTAAASELTGPKTTTPTNAPISNQVIERPSTSTTSTSTPRSPLPPPVPSSKAPRPTPTGPPDRPHADSIIERPYSSTTNPNAPPQEPDELDPALLQQQATTEYHRQRNRMIYRQGGFLPKEEDEEDDIPLDTNGNEQGRKVSRFMAARLGRR